MPNTISSANMGLPIPVVGTDPGPDWANQNNNCLTIIDSHNHSSGSGVQINPSGLNINSDLPFNTNNLTLVRTVRFNPQGAVLTAPADVGCLYEVGVDLYYNDGNGNNVRITQSGGVAGSPGSISNLNSPASAAYVGANSTFVWQSAANTPANLDAASLIIRNVTANSNGITLSAPNALGSNYTLTLPSVPAQTNVMTIDNSGNMSSITYNSVGTNMTATGANAIANSRTRATGSTVGVGGVAESASSGAVTTVSSTPVDVANLSVTITTSGRPVFVAIVSDGSGTGACLRVEANSSTQTCFGLFYILNGSTVIATQQIFVKFPSASTQNNADMPASLFHIDFPAAGTYTYKVQISSPNGSAAAVGLQEVKLVAFEL